MLCYVNFSCKIFSMIDIEMKNTTTVMQVNIKQRVFRSDDLSE